MYPSMLYYNSTLNGPSTSQKWTKNGDLQTYLGLMEPWSQNGDLLGTLYLLGPLKLEIEKYAFVSGFGREHTDFIVVEKVHFWYTLVHKSQKALLYTFSWYLFEKCDLRKDPTFNRVYTGCLFWLVPPQKVLSVEDGKIPTKKVKVDL